MTILAMQGFKERMRTMGLMDARGRLTCELYYKSVLLVEGRWESKKDKWSYMKIFEAIKSHWDP